MDLKTYTTDTNIGALMFQAFSVISLQLHAFSGRLLAAGVQSALVFGVVRYSSILLPGINSSILLPGTELILVFSKEDYLVA